MRNQYKILAEKYNQVLEADQEPTLRVGPDGTKSWRLNGKFHRLDGPAIEWTDGTKSWYQNGKLHRLDGPALESPRLLSKAWYIDGIEYNEKKFDLKKRTRELLKKASDETGIEMDI